MTIQKHDKNSITETAEKLKQGGVVIIPTDTVYGFSGIVNGSSKSELYNTDKKIMAIKGRNESKPLIQLIAKPEDIFSYTDDEIPQTLKDKWPGALTIIVNVKKNLELFNTQKTVAFRCPGDEWLRSVILECGRPIFSTSVNRSGFPVLNSQNEICKEFEKDCSLVVLDGDKINALPSTLVSIENKTVKVLRQGSVKI